MYKTIVNNKLEQTYKKGTKHCKSSHLGNTQLWFTRRTIEKQDIITQFG